MSELVPQDPSAREPSAIRINADAGGSPVIETDEAERLVEALDKLEAAAPPDAYWYVDGRKGVFDALVEWQERRKEEGVPGFAAAKGVDTAPPLANRSGIALAGLIVFCVTIGALAGMRSQFSRESHTVNAGDTGVTAPASPIPNASLLPAPGLTISRDDADAIAEVNAPTVRLTESQDPVTESDPPGNSAVALQAPLPVSEPAPAVSSESPAAAAPKSVEKMLASGVQKAAPPAVSPAEVTGLREETPVVVYAPPARIRSAEIVAPVPRRRPAREGRSARIVSTRSESRRNAGPSTERRPARRVRRESRDDEQQRVEREAESRFRQEYRREFNRGRRMRDDWRTTPTSPVDPRNPNWGWD